MSSLLETLMKRMGFGDRKDIADEAKELLRRAEANQNVSLLYLPFHCSSSPVYSFQLSSTKILNSHLNLMEPSH